MKWMSAFVGLLLLCLRASAENKADTSFTQALAEAKRLVDTDAGKAYDGEFAKVVAPRLGDIVSGCTKNLGPKINFEVVFVFAADGRVQQVLTPGDQPAAACVGDKLRDLRLPAPPRANWPVQLSIDINPDNASKVRALDTKFAQSDFSVFWKKFSSAAISGDKMTVAEMTKFPLSMPYLVKTVKTKSDFLRRYDEIFKGEANAAQCFRNAEPQKEAGRYEIYCPFKETPNDKENAPIRFIFELTKSGWKFSGLDNINE